MCKTQKAPLPTHCETGSRHARGAVQVQTPVAIVDHNIHHMRSERMRAPTRAVAEAFVNYLFTAEAQAEFVAVGFRRVVAPYHTW